MLRAIKFDFRRAFRVCVCGCSLLCSFQFAPNPGLCPSLLAASHRANEKKGSQQNRSLLAIERKNRGTSKGEISPKHQRRMCVCVCAHTNKTGASVARVHNPNQPDRCQIMLRQHGADVRNAEQRNSISLCTNTHTHTTCGVLARSKVCNIYTIAGALCFEFRARSRYVVNPGAAVADVCVRMFYTSVQY